MLTLYYAPNTISIATAIALHEAGLDYTPRRVDFAAAEQRSEGYLQVNPKGRVPALETPHGILTETGAILEFLAATAAPLLVPDDPFRAARMREVMYYLASTMHVNHAHLRRGHRWADQESSWADMAAKVPETMAASAAYMEARHGQPFCLGDALTLADPYAYMLVSWLGRDGVDVGAYPRLSGFLAAMETRSSLQAVRAAGMLD